jgi:hypothetical protein
MKAFDVFQALSSLTYQVSSSPKVPAYVASGGVSGAGDSVVSESQSYALLITGTVLASWNTHAGADGRTSADRQAVMDTFYGYVQGWAKMCKLCNDSSACQSKQLCKLSSDGIATVCLPHWKVKAVVQGKGSAPDGDEDAIIGMILAVQAVANDASKPAWYDEVRAWADASIAAFMEFSTIGDSKNRIVKLGSCWGGWGADGNNPSYHSPGSYK